MLSGSKTSNYRDYLTSSRRNLMEAKMKYANEATRQMKAKINHCIELKKDESVREIPNPGFYPVSKKGVRSMKKRKTMPNTAAITGSPCVKYFP